ncbi:CDP-alcohol phosphatidyltransferase family protein [Brachybacterium sp. GPGPB12]|uniref:CDP-alcohol phosphatidyltransferase family protein n=1 Tax=Brachybacterium sp. GPGPB12 TaxID=3023517 RepID=UPI0031342422
MCLRLADGPDTLGVVLLLVWASTDWIDGMLARALDQTSRTGQIMDPIADRLGLVAIVLTLALADLLPWAALAVIVVVDAAMALLATRAALGGRISVSWLGKIRTFVLMASVFLLVAVAAWAPSLVPIAQALVWVGAVAARRLRRGLHRQGAAGPCRRTGGGGTSFAAMTRARGTRTSPRRVITCTTWSSTRVIVPSASVIDSPCGERSRSIA